MTKGYFQSYSASALFPGHFAALSNKLAPFNLFTKLNCRNRSKGEALEAKSKVLFILKTMFDAISRILIFSIWLYVINDGQFSSWACFGAFYTMIAVMFIFNVIFNYRRNVFSMEYWIGKYLCSSELGQFYSFK